MVMSLRSYLNISWANLFHRQNSQWGSDLFKLYILR